MPRINRKGLLTGLAVLLLLSVWFHPSFLRGDIDSVRYRALSKLDSVVCRINPRWSVWRWVPGGWRPLPTMHHCCDDIQYFPDYEEFQLPETVREHIAYRQSERCPEGWDRAGELFKPNP